MAAGDVLWQPGADAAETTKMGQWLSWLRSNRGTTFATYDEAWAWSVTDLEAFWSSVAEYLGVRFHTAPRSTMGTRQMPGAEWFPGSTLNYAEHLLARAPEHHAVIGVSQTRAETIDLGAADLASLVARARAALGRLGVSRGDRVVAYMPNIPETLVAFLATASLGAIWASCPPEFGVRAVVDRLAQIGPKVLITVDGYRHRGRAIDRAAEVAALRAALPSLTATIVLPYLDPGASLPTGAVGWDDVMAADEQTGYDPVPFAHPLYVLYSSGTTGRPKAIVHSHGGILLEHMKMHALHHDMGPGDRFFWYSTTGWMMWNYLVSALAVGASIVLYDGDPAYPDIEVLWRLAAQAQITHFGVSAPFLSGCRKAGLDLRSLELGHLREIGSTGAPLPASGFRWVYEHVKRDVVLASVSGGTDLCTAFVGGSPLLPVVEGEITCRCLGAPVAAYDANGHSVVGTEGQLVLTAPMPSMPIGFWADDDGSAYRAAYFDRIPGVWDHGDWITITDRGTCIISGRSDATLNRGGVRIGTSDFYGVVESLPEVADSLVVHLDDADAGLDELLLFVQVAPEGVLDDALRAKIVGALRESLSPRHVPDEIIAAPSIPRTLSGKKLEVPVKRVLMGTPAEKAASEESLADPSSIRFYAAIADRRRRAGAS